MRAGRWVAAIAASLLLFLTPTAASANQEVSGTVTAYCDQGVTASGEWTEWGTAAGAYWIPLGSLVWVQGYGTVLITDRGQPGLFTIDLSMPGSCWQAEQWGRKYWVPIYVERWGW